MRRRSAKLSKMRKLILIGIGVILLLFLVKIAFEFVKYIPVAYQLLFHKEIELKNSEDDKVNILLLGRGGGRHDGPDLTDTIILLNLDPTNNNATTISIPRDLWVKDLNAKINTAYASGKSKQEGGGITLTKAVVQKVTGQPIDYAVVIDFDGFVKAVDLVGGLEINVENTLDDYEYPLEGKETDTCGQPEEKLTELATASSQLEAFPCRYKHLHVDKGLQHMDGKLALEFVRSRHATGSEGTDFARSKRQAKVINAFRDKVFSLETFLNPGKVLSLYSTLKGSIDTDIKEEEFDDFIRLAQKMKEAKINSLVIDMGDEGKGRVGLLTNPPITDEFRYQYVLIPTAGNGNFKGIEEYIKCQIENCVTPKPSKTP